VSVYGTVTHKSRLEVFLGGGLFPVYGLSPPIGISEYETADLPAVTSYMLRPPIPTGGWDSPPRHPITQTIYKWYRNIKPVSHRLRLSASA